MSVGTRIEQFYWDVKVHWVVWGQTITLGKAVLLTSY